MRIVAPRIKVRGLQGNELREVLEWVGDPAFRGDFLPFSKATERETTKGLRKMVGSGRPHFLGIEKTSSRRLIGLLLYHRPQGFDYFEVGFYLMPMERGKGYGPDALKWLVSFLFERNHVATILAGTSSLNVVSQRALEKAGFKREGLWKKTLFRNEKWEDSLIYVLHRGGREQ
jgi:RimJ/RimL family protein N-acetyltransferase